MQNPVQHYVVQQVWSDCWNAINSNAPYLPKLPIPQNMQPQDVQLLLDATDVTTQNTLLHQAVFKNIYDFTQELLACGSNVNQQNGFGETPLHLAAGNGNFALARLLLQYGASFDLQDAKKNTPLDFAFLYKREDVVQLLILWGAKITPYIQNDQAKKTRMNLTILLRNEFLSWARGVKNQFTFTGLDNKSMTGDGFQYLETIEAQLKKSFKQEQDYKERKKSVPPEITQQTQSIQRQLDAFIDCHADNRGTLLHVAVENGQINVLRVLVDCPSINESWFNERDVDGNTALIKAVEKNNKDMVGFLVMSGVDQSIKNNKGYSALNLAQQMKRFDLVSFLSPSETFEYVVLPPKLYVSPQKPPVSKEKSKGVLKSLEENLEIFKKQGVDVTDTEETFSDKDIDKLLLLPNLNYYMYGNNQQPRYTYLHGAVLNGNGKAAEKLLNKNWQLLYMPDNQNSGKLPIHYAAMLDRLYFVEYFLKFEDWLFNNKQIPFVTLKSQKDLFGRTPLSYAAMTGDVALCEMLFSLEANVADKRGVTPLFYPAQEGNWKLVQWFLNQNPFAISQVDSLGKSVLSYALKSGNSDLISKIISYAKTKKVGPIALFIPLFDKVGNSVLTDAILIEMPSDKEKNRGTIVEILCKEYPDLINKPDRFGETPLHYVLAKNKDLEMAKILLRYGADLSIKNKKDKTVRDRVVPGSEFAKFLEKTEKEQQQLFIDFVHALAEIV